MFPVIETDSFHSDKLNNSKHAVYGKFTPLSPKQKNNWHQLFYACQAYRTSTAQKKRESVFPSRWTPTSISLGESEFSFLPSKSLVSRYNERSYCSFLKPVINLDVQFAKVNLPFCIEERFNFKRNQLKATKSHRKWLRRDISWNFFAFYLLFQTYVYINECGGFKGTETLDKDFATWRRLEIGFLLPIVVQRFLVLSLHIIQPGFGCD